MGNDLHRSPQIIAAALLANYTLVDLSGREVAVLTCFCTHKTFVVAQIEICFSAIFGDEYLAMLKRTHGARINIDVGVELHHLDLEAARLQQSSKRCCGNAFSKG